MLLTSLRLPAPEREAQSRRGFTLVEMLVVIAIIAVLAAMLLPAIQMAREAGRRASCSNNMKNLALAIMQFDTAKGMYPASRTYWQDQRYLASGNYPQQWGHSSPQPYMLSWVHEILPYIEKQDMRTLIENNLLSTNPKYPVYAVASRLNIVLCPSDETDDNISANDATLPYSQLSYACNAGVPDNIGNPFVYGFDWMANGVFENRLIGSGDKTSYPSFKFKKPTMADVTNGDGASNTIMLGENAELEEWNYCPTEFHVGIVWDDTFNLGQQVGKFPSGLTPPNTKPATLAEMYNLSAPVPNNVVPYARPRSEHPTGFMAAFCDGRTKFISDSVAYNVYCLLMTSNGKKYQSAGYNTLQTVNQNAAQLQKTAVLKDGDF